MSNMKLVFEKWNRFLYEADETLAVAHYADDRKVKGHHFVAFLEKDFLELTDNLARIPGGVELSDIIVGYVNLREPKTKKQKCMNALEVRYSVVSERFRGKGYGKKIYQIAMGAMGRPIMSDRSSVSDDAKRIWNSFSKDSSVESFPSNDGDFVGFFDNVDEPETAPEEDDCKIHGDEILDKAYYSEEYKEMANKSIGLANSLLSKLPEPDFKMTTSKEKVIQSVVTTAGSYLFNTQGVL